jgi:ParB family chromosome partitioning protein
MAKETQKGWAAVGKATKALSQQDQTVRAEADRDREQTQRGFVPLADIRPRPHGDSRQVDAHHVLDLAESVAALGLLEPLVVDRRLHLLAGAHRWAAVRLLAIKSPEERATAWGVMAGISELKELQDKSLTEVINRIQALVPMAVPAMVPVRIVEFDAEAEEDRALSIEVAENEKRRDYTKQEVTALAERLKKAGFRFSRGKPKAGERALGPALAVIIGKSERTVRRLIDGEEDIRTDVLITKSDPLPDIINRLKKTIVALQSTATGSAKRQLTDVLRCAKQLEERIKKFESETQAQYKRKR